MDDVVVVGAGPAGAMAAIEAARRGKRVSLVERKDQPFQKLLLTGSGRCNITNSRDFSEFPAFYHNGDFLRSALYAFSNIDLLHFCEERGLSLREERGKRMFPATLSSESVVQLLRKELERVGVQLWFNKRITSLTAEKERFEVVVKGKTFWARSVVIATGGMSYPVTGSTGDGYQFARDFGHSVILPEPVLCGLETHYGIPKVWWNLSLENVKASLTVAGKERQEEFGDMTFTDYGLSGPILFHLSRIFHSSECSKGVEVRLDLKPALTEEMLLSRIDRECRASRGSTVSRILKNLLPSAMADDFARMHEFLPERSVRKITLPEKERLMRAFKQLSFTIRAKRPISEAIITRGGINVREVDPRRMESRIVPGLFFAGEVLDIDGATGGFNLQSAFSTGFLAGSSL